MQRYRREEEEKNDTSDEDTYIPYVSVKDKKRQALAKLGRITALKDEGKKNKSSSECEMENEDDEGAVWGRKSNISLLDQHTELKKLAEGIKARKRN